MRTSRLVLAAIVFGIMSGCATPEMIATQKQAEADRWVARREGRLIEVEIQRPPIVSRYYGTR